MDEQEQNIILRLEREPRGAGLVELNLTTLLD